jgi:hypothetical protein
VPLDPTILEQVLKTPDTQDVTQSSIVSEAILQDPSNAADLVGALDAGDTLEARNARKILCEFESPAVPHLLEKVADVGVNARQQILEVLWALLITETPTAKRDSLRPVNVKAKLNMLLDDRRPLPDRLPAYIERDFSGRLCDLAYVVIQQLLSATFDQSLFQSLENADRDSEILVLKTSDLSEPVA